MGVDGFRHRFDFFVGRIQSSKPDIVANRAGENKRILKDDADLAAQRFQLHVADIHAVDRDFPAGNVVEPAEQVDDRAFA